MFTGLIRDIGIVSRISPRAGMKKLTIKTALDTADMNIGDSIAVSGACLTITKLGRDWFEVDLSSETTSKTTLGEVRINSRVNLEPPLKAQDPIGGHLVTGHVDTIGRIKSKIPKGDSLEISITISRDWLPYLVEKGSIAVDGISLTINRIKGDTFWVMIIPHTLQKTTIGQLPVGARVNIETDIIGKFVVNFIKNYMTGRRTEEILKKPMIYNP